MTTKDRLDYNSLKSKLNKEFDIKEMGKANKILEIQNRGNRMEGKLLINQQKYFEMVLANLGYLLANLSTLH